MGGLGQSPGLIGHLFCRLDHFAVESSIDGSVAAIRQSVTFHRGRFTAVNSRADWRRNKPSVFIAESVNHPLTFSTLNTDLQRCETPAENHCCNCS